MSREFEEYFFNWCLQHEKWIKCLLFHSLSYTEIGLTFKADGKHGRLYKFKSVWNNVKEIMNVCTDT